jgi:hypothetical protein
MVTYKFKLIDSKVPVMKGRSVVTDSNVGGQKNTYEIYLVRPNWIWDKYIGLKTFWRPYQTVWDKKGHRVHAPYWGKGPLMNMWIVLSNDYADPSDQKALLQDDDTTKHVTLVYGTPFLSQILNNNLKSNKSFYQSKFENHGSKKQKKIGSN